MFSDYQNEKQSSLPSPTCTRTHSPHSSISSTTSTLSSPPSPKKYDESSPPPYSYIFYNSIDDKPLPPLPTSLSIPNSLSMNSYTKEHKVRFAEEKPLPPLPPCDIDENENEGRTLKRMGSGNGEYAWWTKRSNMSDEEYEQVAKEKERVRSGSMGKFTEEI
jgi:hypothetical protein